MAAESIITTFEQGLGQGGALNFILHIRLPRE
jgi:hypothetical protein